MLIYVDDKKCGSIQSKLPKVRNWATNFYKAIHLLVNTPWFKVTHLWKKKNSLLECVLLIFVFTVLKYFCHAEDTVLILPLGSISQSKHVFVWLLLWLPRRKKGPRCVFMAFEGWFPEALAKNMTDDRVRKE